MKYLFVFLTTLVGALADLPTLEQIRKTSEAPMKIKATGKYESLETLKDGVPHGLTRSYHPNGQLYRITPWTNGQKNGQVIVYREDGRVEQVLHYTDDLLDGFLVWVKEDGTIDRYAEYSLGHALGRGKCSAKVPFSGVEKELSLRTAVVGRCTTIEEVNNVQPSRPRVEKVKNVQPIRASFDCTKANSKSEKAICASPRLANVDRLMNEKYELARKELPPEIFKELKASQLRWLKSRDECVTESNDKKTEKCLIQSMRERNKIYEAFRLRNTKGQGSVEKARKLISEIEGEFEVKQELSAHDIGDYVATDKLVIQKTVEPKMIYFSVGLSFTEGHSCSLSGEAIFMKDESFFFRDFEDDPECKLTIRKVGSDIQLEDGGTCKGYCGVNGSIDGASFPLKPKAK